MVQARPLPLALARWLIMVALPRPRFGMRLDSSDAGNDPSGTSTERAFNLLAGRLRAGLQRAAAGRAELHGASAGRRRCPRVRAAVGAHPDVVAGHAPRVAPSGKVAVMRGLSRFGPSGRGDDRPRRPAAPQRAAAAATAQLGCTVAGRRLHRRLDRLLQRARRASCRCSSRSSCVLSALLLFVIFRSLVIPLQAGVMNLLQHRRRARRDRRGLPVGLAVELLGISRDRSSRGSRC